METMAVNFFTKNNNSSNKNQSHIIPEIHEQWLVIKRVHVTNSDMGYDIIIGMDLLRELRTDILNSTCSIKLDEAEIVMRPRDSKMEDSYV